VSDPSRPASTIVTERSPINGEIVASPPPPKVGKHPMVWDFVWKPRWILSHLFVLLCILAMLYMAGFELARLHGRRSINHMIEAREQVGPVPIQSLVGAHQPDAVANHKDFRQTTVTGRYDEANQMLIRNEQDPDDDPGWWLVTPMILPDGTAVAVNRGFVPLTLGDTGLLADEENRPLPQYRPPSGTVTVTGMIFPTQNRTGGPYDPGAGHLHTLSRVDLNRWQRQVPYRLFPVYVNLASSRPAQKGTYPQPVVLPPLNDGPHLNYTGQWLIFATLTAIVYPLLLRRNARNRAVTEEDATVSASGGDEDAGDDERDRRDEGDRDDPVLLPGGPGGGAVPA
jgi:surfeit locus 1 family protein